MELKLLQVHRRELLKRVLIVPFMELKRYPLSIFLDSDIVLIVPFMELKLAKDTLQPVCKGVLIVPFMELKRVDGISTLAKIPWS